MEYTTDTETVVLTSTYGCDYNSSSQYRFVGCYRTTAQVIPANLGFLYTGNLNGLSTAANYQTIQKSSSNTVTYVHSIMGNCTVLNTDNPGHPGGLVLQSKAYVYNVITKKYIDIQFPQNITTTAYGIWWNGGNSYTITGGFSPLNRNITDIYVDDQPVPFGSAYVVDYDSQTERFSNWTRLYLNSPISHCEGISSYFNEPNVYTLSIDYASNNFFQGHLVKVLRTNRGFQITNDIILDPPSGLASANSVANNVLCGSIVSGTTMAAYQCRVIL